MNFSYVAIIVAIMFILSPFFAHICQIFDYPITHILVLFSIFYTKDTPKVATIIAIIYMMCVYQHQKLILEELLNEQIKNPDISTFMRHKISLRLLSNKTITDETKTNFVIRSLSSNSKPIYKLNVLLAYMEKCKNDEFKSDVLNNFYSIKNKNVIVITKLLLDKETNIQIIFNSVTKSPMSSSKKLEIIQYMKNLSILDEDLKRDIKNYGTKHVSFNI